MYLGLLRCLISDHSSLTINRSLDNIVEKFGVSRKALTNGRTAAGAQPKKKGYKPGTQPAKRPKRRVRRAQDMPAALQESIDNLDLTLQEIADKHDVSKRSLVAARGEANTPARIMKRKMT